MRYHQTFELWKINVKSVSDDKCGNEIVNLVVWRYRNVPNLLDICNRWEWVNDNNCSAFYPISKISIHFPWLLCLMHDIWLWHRETKCEVLEKCRELCFNSAKIWAILRNTHSMWTQTCSEKNTFTWYKGETTVLLCLLQIVCQFEHLELRFRIRIWK